MLTIKKSSFLTIVLLFLAFSLSSQDFSPDFYAFEWGLRGARSDQPEYWADLLVKTGFNGMELMGLDKVDEMLPALKKKGLKLYTVYLGIDLDSEEPYDPLIKEYLKKWKGEVPYLCYFVKSKKYEISDPAGDARCIEIINELADMAEPSGIKLVFYPHIKFWLESSMDGVRLSEKINRDHVGTAFNLAHFLKMDDPSKLKERLAQAMPYLFLVSVNGADEGNTNEMGWDRMIQPLGQGSYDVYHLLQVLKDMGYNNPVGLQCYNIKDPSEEHLSYSGKTWKKYIKEINNPPEKKRN